MHDDEPSRRAPKRILIVEDNALNLKVLHDLLQAYGYAMLVAGDGTAGLAVAGEQRPDLILLDLQLPDVSGYQVAQRLKSEDATRGIPVVAVTAFAMVGDERRALASGCDAYIAKPIRIRQLLDLVGRFTGAAPLPPP